MDTRELFGRSFRSYMKHWPAIGRIMAPVALISYFILELSGQLAAKVQVRLSQEPESIIPWASIIRRDSFLVMGFLLNWALYIVAFAVINKAFIEWNRGSHSNPIRHYAAAASPGLILLSNMWGLAWRVAFWAVGWIVAFIVLISMLVRFISFHPSRLFIEALIAISLAPLSLPISSICLRFSAAVIENKRLKDVIVISEEGFRSSGFALSLVLSVVALGAVALSGYVMSDFGALLLPRWGEMTQTVSFQFLFPVFYSFASSILWSVFMIACAIVIVGEKDKRSPMQEVN